LGKRFFSMAAPFLENFAYIFIIKYSAQEINIIFFKKLLTSAGAYAIIVKQIRLQLFFGVKRCT